MTGSGTAFSTAASDSNRTPSSSPPRASDNFESFFESVVGNDLSSQKFTAYVGWVLALIVLLLLLLLLPVAASAQNLQPGDIAIVGSPRDTIGSIQVQGSAYIFIRNGGTWAPSWQCAARRASRNGGRWRCPSAIPCSTAFPDR